MDRFRSLRRFQTPDPTPKIEHPPDPPENGAVAGDEIARQASVASEELEGFVGVKVGGKKTDTLRLQGKGDHIGLRIYPSFVKVLAKQGDHQVLFADKVMKFTGSGKVKRRILVITEFAMYIVDPEGGMLKRRIALAAVEKLRLSELNDNFFAVIIPTEYDCLMASTRKTEILAAVVQATNGTSEELVEYSNSFEYHAADDLAKEVKFTKDTGVLKTKIIQKASK